MRSLCSVTFDLREQTPTARTAGRRCRHLEPQDYEYAEWRLVRVGLDYLVEAAGFFYSVPRTFIRAEVDVRVTAHRRGVPSRSANRRP